MKGKLINRWGDYRLYVNETPYATTGDSPYKKLSKQNCDELFGEVDIEPFIIKDSKDKTIYNESYELGFKRAMKLMGDKKFSEQDVISMIEKSRETGLTAEYLILSMKQTEWDVEIEMDKIPADRAPNGWDEFPKLDENGCLILKRI